MTDIDFYEAIGRCFTADPQHKRCNTCPLLKSERACEYVLRDEIRHRLIMARQDKSNGFTQLNLFETNNPPVKPMGDGTTGYYCGRCGRKFTDGVGNYCQACGARTERI